MSNGTWDELAAGELLGGSILIVDDDDMIASSFRHILAKRGCHIDLARERRSAEELLALRRYDVVIVDPYLTGEVEGDGSLLGRIRTLQAEAEVVILSAYTARSVLNAPSFRTTIVRKPQPVPFLINLVAALLRQDAKPLSAPLASETIRREVER